MQPANTCKKHNMVLHHAHHVTMKEVKYMCFKRDSPCIQRNFQAIVHITPTYIGKQGYRKSVIHISPQSYTTCHLSLLKHCLLLHMLKRQALTVRQDIASVRQDDMQVYASTLAAFIFLILSLRVSSSIYTFLSNVTKHSCICKADVSTIGIAFDQKCTQPWNCSLHGRRVPVVIK